MHWFPNANNQIYVLGGMVTDTVDSEVLTLGVLSSSSSTSTIWFQSWVSAVPKSMKYPADRMYREAPVINIGRHSAKPFWKIELRDQHL